MDVVTLELEKCYDMLRLLYKHRDGLGHNALRRLGVPRRIIKPCREKLLKKGFITVENVKTKGGTSILHVITKKGVEFTKPNIMNKRIEDAVATLMKRFDSSTEEEQIRVLGQIVGKMFVYGIEQFVSGKNKKLLPLFRTAICNPMREYRNKDILKHKKGILNETKKYVLIDKTSPLPTLICVKRIRDEIYESPQFLFERFPIQFVLWDANYSLAAGYWLNRHHRWVFENLLDYDMKEIEKHNREWKNRHKADFKKCKFVNQKQHDLVLPEIKKRINIVKAVPSPNRFRFDYEDYGKWDDDFS